MIYFEAKLEQHVTYFIIFLTQFLIWKTKTYLFNKAFKYFQLILIAKQNWLHHHSCVVTIVVEFTLIYVNLWFLLTIQVEERGGKCIPVQCDHTNDEDVKYLFERVMDEQGRLDVLVNNAYEGISVSYRTRDICRHKKATLYPQTWDLKFKF